MTTERHKGETKKGSKVKRGDHSDTISNSKEVNDKLDRGVLGSRRSNRKTSYLLGPKKRSI